MDDLQKKVVQAIALYPDALTQHSILKRVMADVFGNERIKGKAFCLAFGLGIADACKNNQNSIKDIYESLKDDYLVSDENAKWVIFTWCEIFNLQNYEGFLEPCSVQDTIVTMFGDAVAKINVYVSQQQEEIEKEKKRKEEEQRLKMLQVKKILEKYNKYRDRTISNDVIELFVSLFLYLQREKIVFESVIVEKRDSQKLTVSANSSKVTIQGKIDNYNINIGVNDKGVRLQNTNNFEEKKMICTFLEDIVSAKELLEGLSMIIKYVVQNNFYQCIVTEKGCIIKGIRVNLNKGSFYYGSQLLKTNKK